MALTVNTNVSSINAQRNLTKSGEGLATSMERLASGMRINSAKDDAAGLQISNRLTSQINGLSVAQRNANDGISMAQTAEGAMQESTNILQRMRELALQSANGSNSDSDRDALQKEVSALQTELTRIADTTSFGGQQLLDGSYGTKKFQVGANANETIDVSLSNIAADSIGQNAIKGGGSIFNNTAAVGTAFNTATSTDTTFSGPVSNSAATDISGQNAQEVAATINGLGTGIDAQTSVTATIAGFTSGDTGTLTVGDKTFDLASYKGSAKELASDLGKSGVNATYSSDTDSVVIEETDVAGVMIVGGATNTMTLNSTTADDGGVVVDAQLNLTSSESFSVGGTSADIVGATSSTLDQVAKIDLKTAVGSQDALAVIDAALAGIDAQRADLGAVQNRFGHTISNLANISENVSASRSRIQDTDFATETAHMTKNQILQQAGTSILSQANQIPQAAISLLGG
ncbi:flagellin [Pseudoalteromonas sp. CuT4-3]|uniref:flagellin n=1 Tax=Pseudoalteromonas sp. CuT4-3 TaxID=3112573 RepID=UPI002D7858CC|nr:flagellin [Pseudoalteromonas sp. CuT 4-3]WRU72218.1 flagellin [Pseudoalteromonas sp. CuT 4-3]